MYKHHFYEENSLFIQYYCDNVLIWCIPLTVRILYSWTLANIAGSLKNCLCCKNNYKSCTNKHKSWKKIHLFGNDSHVHWLMPFISNHGTEAESQASEPGLRFQISISSGAITDALNHKLNAHNSANPIHTNALHEPRIIKSPF